MKIKKKFARKKAAEYRVNLYTTGGGPNTNTFNDPTLDLTLSIVNEKTLYGLQNKFDDDAVKMQSSPHPKVTNTNVNSQIENIEDWENVIEVDEEQIILEVEENEGNEDTGAWQHYKPSSLQTPLNEKLKKVIQDNAKEMKTPSKRSLGENTWTTRRRPVNSANASVARKFEELTEIKTQIANVQLEMAKMEKENYSCKRARDAELHELQKASLQLDISIKKKQLEKLNML
ncbi:hypothetical protein NQ317_013488 [Molorchus minor]|uniref:Uncharacterized protein n=1 Tax=Molorchus minor TaxID=1323400 RepID=A0ABQ9JBK5_9CUCU|nr:hypothetical protein NQ317_013488 [Molorchus minor]